MNKSSNAHASTISKGAGIALAGIGFGTVFRYLLQILITRELGAELFGLFFLGFSLFRVASVFSEIGLSYGVVRYVSIFKGQKDPERIKGTISLSLKLGLAASLVIGGLIYLFSGILAAHVFRKPDLIRVLKYFAFILPFFTLTTILLLAAQGLKVIKAKAVIRDMAEPLLRIGLTALFFWMGWQMEGVLTAFLLASISALVLSFSYLSRLFPQLIQPSIRALEETKTFFHYSWPLVFVQFMAVLLMWTDTIMLGIFRLSAEVGIYGAAQRTALLCSLVITAFHSIFTPVIADLFQKTDTSSVRHLLKNVSRWSFSLTLPFGIVLLVFSEFFLSLFGAEFPRGKSALAILTAGWIVHSLLGLSSSILTMSGRSRLHLLNTGLFFLTNIGLNLWLITRFGMTGAAWATTASIIMLDIAIAGEIHFLLRLNPLQLKLWKPSVAGAAVFLLFKTITFFTGDLKNGFLITAAAVLFLMVYFSLLYLMRLDKEDAAILRKFFS
jgi:O-antigen/teichoic acid export membrane protein